MNSDITQGDYVLHVTNTSLHIQNTKNNKLISIEKYNGRMYESDISILKSLKIGITINPHAILGIVRVSNIDFLAYVKIAQLVGSLENSEIFKIKETEFIPITEDLFAANLSQDVKNQILGIKQIFSLGFFYSFNYDLTSTKQKQQSNRGLTLLESTNKTFFWNFNLYSRFFEAKIDSSFMAICICGYIGITSHTLFGNNIVFALISRRSTKHAGTRYNTRGINDNGEVANFVESEQIVKYRNQTISFVQIRGSAPIFFQQIGLTAQTQITRTSQMTVNAFAKHIESLHKNFPMIYFINLMNSTKPGEQSITESLELQVKECSSAVKYCFFDFQNECKFDDYDKIEGFIKTKIDPILKLFKHYSEEENSENYTETQNGVIRTNCLDCLDRTNVIQTRIAWRALEKQLASFDINTDLIFEIKFLNTPKDLRPHPFMKIFKDIWAENGDYISIQYAGTASTASNVTKNGKNGIFGLFHHGMVTISRFYQGSFEDNFKQKCIETILQTDESNKNVTFDYELSKYSDKFTEFEKLKVFIGSWNTAANSFDSDKLSEWLIPENTEQPDVYIIGFQEIVSLNASNLLITSNSKQIDYWRNIIERTINHNGNKYIFLKHQDLVGILMFVYIKENLKDNITNLEYDIIRTGAMGLLGNKGSVVIRFNYLDSSLCAACCHLMSDTDKKDSRIAEMFEILNKSFPKEKNLRFNEHDFYFIFGDLNFRIDLDNNTCRKWIENKNLESLVGYDQLKKITNPELLKLDEGPLIFEPTYKYDIGTNNYDTSKKKRTPGWCDRILFNKNSDTELLQYNKVEYTNSDHRPVFAVLNLNVKRILNDKKEEIIRSLGLEMNKNLSLNEEVQTKENLFISNQDEIVKPVKENKIKSGVLGFLKKII